ncbi:MAG: DUF3299 domain-containing protein [Alphaproteobacteria bacterium]|nr:DUF3299 domain-containing protein [Alphaproteobacteria bacterium]
MQTLTRRQILIAAAAGAAGMTPPRQGQAQEILSDLPLDQHGWSAAPSVGDSIGWEVWGATREEERQVNGQLWTVPRFTSTVRRLDGRRVRVNGYMMEWDATPRQRRFLLLAYPTTCPFHLSVGPSFCIDVRSPEGVLYDPEAMLIEGTMNLLEQDPEMLFYRMTDARRIGA